MCGISSINEHYDNCESGWCSEGREKEDEHNPKPVPTIIRYVLLTELLNYLLCMQP
jgi:hypothetical protein